MAPDAHALATLAPQTPAEPQSAAVRLTRTARADWQPAEADPPLRNGAVIDGRYRVVSVIGEGGMGRVYETEHLFLRRRLALKLVRRDAGTGEAAARLLQEAVLAGKVPHATVVPVFDCAALPDGQVYVAMELLRGESLEEALLRPQRAEEVLRWLAEVARGLAAAHRAGIVHRDVKPANLFLARTNDGRVQPRILDFGIAKLLPGLAGEAGAAVQTQAGALLGTPFYMAPERIRGETGDGSADLYGFGVILYEALTGQVPFLADGFMEIVARHLREPPLDPRQAAPQRRIPDALAELALALLRKDPQARPGDGDAVAAALLAVLEREPVAVANLWLGAEAPVSAAAATQAIEEGSTQRLEGQVLTDMSRGAGSVDGAERGGAGRADLSQGAGLARASATAATLVPGLDLSAGTGAERSAQGAGVARASATAATLVPGLDLSAGTGAERSAQGAGFARASATAATLAPELELSVGTGADERSGASMSRGAKGSSAGAASAGSAGDSLSAGTASSSRAARARADGPATDSGGAAEAAAVRTDMSSRPGTAAGSLRVAALVLACAAGGLVAWVLMPRDEAGADRSPAPAPDGVGVALPFASPGSGPPRTVDAAPGGPEPADSQDRSATTGSSPPVADPGPATGTSGASTSGTESGSATPGAAATTGPAAEPEATATDPEVSAPKKRGKKAPRKAGTTEPGPREAGPKIKTDVYDE
ncbi:serine/threonine protein kinase [Nannocystis punicea]|uniref:non-specific serine/threonine protein kinase n=1 Tax=Nannocystis punicea TaxID=2995304 RepID=A0ABY7HGL5_9BACT|nr:protein kinase [Nannocystis poenicansa]WAS98457.1 protein kinase [Nannocystis poenicansa]